MLLNIFILMALSYFVRFLSFKIVAWFTLILTILGLIVTLSVYHDQILKRSIVIIIGGIILFIWLWLLVQAQDTIFTFLIILLGGSVLISFLYASSAQYAGIMQSINTPCYSTQIPSLPISNGDNSCSFETQAGDANYYGVSVIKTKANLSYSNQVVENYIAKNKGSVQEGHTSNTFAGKKSERYVIKLSNDTYMSMIFVANNTPQGNIIIITNHIDDSTDTDPGVMEQNWVWK